MATPSDDRNRTAAKQNTGDYSATQAKENREHVESDKVTADPSLIPGGLLGSPKDIGASALDESTVPIGSDGLHTKDDALKGNRRSKEDE